MTNDDTIRFRYRLPIGEVILVSGVAVVIGVAAFLFANQYSATQSFYGVVTSRIQSLAKISWLVSGLAFASGAVALLVAIDRLRRIGTIRISDTYVILPTSIPYRRFVSIPHNDIRRLKFSGDYKQPDACTVFFSRGKAHLEMRGFESAMDFSIFKRALEQRLKRADLLYPSAPQFRHWSD